MQVTAKLVGTKPLLLQNVELANPRNEWFRKMAALRGVSSRNRTDQWLDDMEYANYMGAFYDIPEIDGTGIPCENIRQALIQAAKATRDGPKATRGIQITEASVPLIYDGPRTPKELWDDGRFKLTRMVRGTGGASPTTYPVFNEWALRVPFELEERELNVATLTDIAVRAGRVIGLGACRKQGFGRFDSLIETS